MVESLLLPVVRGVAGKAADALVRSVTRMWVRMKMERKYAELNRIAFCILSDRIRIFVSNFTVFAFIFIFQM
jgi:hypothetical protein